MRTIAAIATGNMNCAIHIIKVSGPDCFKIINKVIKKPLKLIPNSIQHNFIIDNNKQIIDEVLLNVFVKPNSYSGEDCIEINCHGGNLLAHKILDLLVINGCEYALNGEFSQQAFLNKKINYQQIEGINNLIHANNDLAINFALESMLGHSSDKIKQLRDQIFNIMGSIEVNIDYPEYDDVSEYSHQDLIEMLTNINQSIKQVIDQSKIIKPVFEGFLISIIGKPNVGKSSLLNKLSKQEKAIVHNKEGTTRDIVESSLIFNNIPLKILDTAGIRTTNDEIEAIGIKKSIDTIKQADLVIWLIDSQDQDYLNSEITTILNNDTSIKYLKVFNKSDLVYHHNEINISCLNNQLDELINALNDYLKQIHAIKSDCLIMQSQRQLTLIEKIHYLINEIINDLKDKVSVDLIQAPLEKCIHLFNDILGLSFNYDKLDELFSKFCIGK